MGAAVSTAYIALLTILNASEILALVSLAVYAINKIIRLQTGTLGMWRPTWMTHRALTILVCMTSVGELAPTILACWPGASHLLFFPMRTMVLWLCLVVSAYGAFSIWKTGECGCHGAARAKRAGDVRRQIAKLCFRNLGIFGLCYLAFSGGKLALNFNESGGQAMALAECAQYAIAGLIAIWLLLCLPLKRLRKVIR